MNHTERSWKLLKYSDLGSQGGVFTNNITLKILLQKCILIVFHGPQSLMQISLSNPNLLVKSQANSFFVHSPGKKTDEKFRFRVMSRFDFGEINEIFSRFVCVVQADKNSQQDLFCSQNSQMTFSQGSMYSQSNSQGSVPDFRGAGFSPFNNPMLANEVRKPYTQPVEVTKSYESGMNLTHDYSFSQPPVNHLYNQFPTSPVSVTSWSPVHSTPIVAEKPNPYASSYDQETYSHGNAVHLLDEGSKFSPLKSQKPVVPAMINQSCQTDTDSYENISSEQLVSLIEALTADKSFQLFVQRVSEVLNGSNSTPDQHVPRPDEHENKLILAPAVSAPKIEDEDNTYEKDPSFNGETDSIAETLAKVDAILNGF